MRNVNIVGKVKFGNFDLELTKPLIYVQKDAKKQATTLIFEEKYSLEDIGVMDRQTLIVTEVLTDYAKRVIQDHYLKQGRLRVDSGAKKDTQLLRTLPDYSRVPAGH